MKQTMKHTQGPARAKDAGEDNLTQRPLAHYGAIYRRLDPQVVAKRTNLSFDSQKGVFCLHLVGITHYVTWPDFCLMDADGRECGTAYEAILMLRYLCGGVYVPATGREIAYREFVDARLQEIKFTTLVTWQIIKEFGNDLDSFKKVMEDHPELHAQALERCDAGYRLMFLDNLPLSIRIWRGDDEFLPSAQVLFDENFRFAFSTEDIAVAGTILIEHLIRLRDNKVVTA
ncbi:MAG: DUF3786 domain-containing protein [Coriobacteriales bacterium]|jgi:hypothetical protein|nr:DUF3786 domain-containing protein [Coriobacteriales bacterium]